MKITIFEYFSVLSSENVNSNYRDRVVFLGSDVIKLNGLSPCVQCSNVHVWYVSIPIILLKAPEKLTKCATMTEIPP